MGSEPRAGAGLSRWQGLAWLLAFVLLGWGLSELVLIRSPRPRLLFVSQMIDGRIECYGEASIEITLVSRLDTVFAPGRMVLNVPVLDNPGDDGHVQVVVPAGARTILVDAEGSVTVLGRPVPPPLLQALLRSGGPSMAERVENSEAARAALRFLPELDEFLKRR